MDDFFLPGLPPVVQEAFKRLLNRGIRKRHLGQEIIELLEPEYGSNANGEYVRWGNGLQECTVLIELPRYNTTTQEQNLTIYRLQYDWIYPAEFINIPIIAGLCSLGDYRAIETVGLSKTRPSGSSARLYFQSLYPFEDGYAMLRATGRWK